MAVTVNGKVAGPLGNIVTAETDPVTGGIKVSSGAVADVFAEKDMLSRRYRNSLSATPGYTLLPIHSTTPPSPTGATGSASLDSVVTWKGQPTWKVTNQTIGGNIAVTKNITPFAAQMTAPHLFIPVYVPDYKSLNNIAIHLSMGDSTFANIFGFTWAIGPTGHADKQRNGWHLIAISPSEWTSVTGSPDWTSTINSIRLRFLKDSAGGNDGIAYFGNPIIGVQTVPQLLIYADDVHKSFYEYGLPIFESYGLSVNLACAAAWAQGNQNYMQTADLVDAVSRGHEVCVHSMNQIGVNVATCDAAIADVALNQAFVRDVIKDPFGYKHFVFANGRYWINDRSDMSVVNHMRDSLGFVMGRTTDDPLRATTRTPIGLIDDPDRHNILTLPELAPNNTITTDAGMISAIDTAIARKATGTLVFHVASPLAGNAIMTPQHIDAVAAYLASKVSAGAVRVSTGRQFYQSLGTFSPSAVTSL